MGDGELATSLSTHLRRRGKLPRPSTRLLAALVERPENHLLLLDPDTTVRYASPAMVAFMEDLDVRNIVGRRLPDLVRVVDAGVLDRRIGTLVEGQTLSDQHIRLERPDGSYTDVLGTRRDLRADPEVEGILWILRPVTGERVQAERSRVFGIGSSDVPFILSPDGIVTYVGASITEAFGLMPSHVVGLRVKDVVHPDDQDVLERILASALDGEPTTMARFRLRNAAGEWRWIETALDNHLGNRWIGGLVGSLRDVTDQQSSADALAASERRYRRILETTAEGVWILDADARTIFANDTAREMVVPSPGVAGAARSEDVIGRGFLDFVVAEDRHRVEMHLIDVVQGRSQRFETALLREGGRRLEVQASASPVTEEDGSPNGILIMSTDITRRKRVEKELSRLALHDLLTGLPNRALLLDRIEQALAREGRRAGTTAVLLVDIDAFELWNEWLGHSGGDKVLVAMAERLRAAVRTEDTVARLGDDEFVVLATDIYGTGAAVELAGRVLEAVSTPVSFGDREVEVTASVGISVTPVADSDTLLAHARSAANQARRAGGGRFQLYDIGSEAPVQLRLSSVTELRRAITEGQLRVHYQPVVRLDGQLTGFEALVRWEHPTRGLLPPAEFVDLAEETGLIGDVGAFVLDQACADLRRWQARYLHPNLVVAVNVSARQLIDVSVADQVAAAAARHGVDPSTVVIEITESVLMEDAGRVTSDLEALSRLGCMLAVDDFGTGYSSLLYLKRFPIGALKLDGSFVAGLGERNDDMIIVGAIVEMAHKLGLVAIGEGVETARQAAVLTELGCDLAQGYLWARPMSAAEMDAHFTSSPGGVTFGPTGSAGAVTLEPVEHTG